MLPTMSEPSLDRRAFLMASAALPSAAPLFSASAPAASRAITVDCHAHCFAGTMDKRFPFHARAPYRPVDTGTPEQLLRCMADAVVDYTAVVHPEPYQDDHRYLEHCLAVGKGKLIGTCLFFADRPGWQTAMPALVRRWNLRAVRIHAYAADRLPPFGKPELRAFWKCAADLGVAVQLHFEPRYAARFDPLIKEFSKTAVIIDHLGRPAQGSPEEHKAVFRWADRPNTYLKISSIPDKAQYPYLDVGPIVKNLVAAYGPSRCLTGGGFSASSEGGTTPDTYRAERAKVLSVVSHLQPVDQALIAGGTAAKLFGLSTV